ncbi:hypothetical protein HID58_047751 [Brassica napus]|uniref:Uncharacterized protein n=1 Tax=Brassica napus TaxID=3708 RepID=A0ABQ8B0E3_BRANA|nr:hypothetical protein HID58_047751 [Brassica napus]
MERWVALSPAMGLSCSARSGALKGGEAVFSFSSSPEAVSSFSSSPEAVSSFSSFPGPLFSVVGAASAATLIGSVISAVFSVISAVFSVESFLVFSIETSVVFVFSVKTSIVFAVDSSVVFAVDSTISTALVSLSSAVVFCTFSPEPVFANFTLGASSSVGFSFLLPRHVSTTIAIG